MENQTLVQEKSPKWRQPVSLKSVDLKEAIHKTIDEIEKIIQENNLSILTNSGNESKNIQSLKQFNSEALANLSKRSKKRIVRQIHKLSQKATLTRINKFISFICKLIPGIENYKVLPSKSEQSIIDLRSKYNKAKQEFFKIKTEYKNSKKEYKSSGGLYFA